MTPAYQCPKSHGTEFVHVAKTYRYEPRTFLFWSWVAQVHTGYIARCVDFGCARYWRIGLDGVHEPAGHGEAPRQPDLERPKRDDDDREQESRPPLGGAVRRPRL
jgi:hypothetical protein